MIDINGKLYRIDMDAFMAWVTESPSAEKNVSTMTTLTYPMDDEGIVEKEVTETKSSLNETMNNVRYDFARLLLNTLFTNNIDNMGGITMNIKDLSFGQRIAFNTLLAKKIITE
jgi:hypothetical protein